MEKYIGFDYFSTGISDKEIKQLVKDAGGEVIEIYDSKPEHKSIDILGDESALKKILKEFNMFIDPEIDAAKVLRNAKTEEQIDVDYEHWAEKELPNKKAKAGAPEECSCLKEVEMCSKCKEYADICEEHGSNCCGAPAMSQDAPEMESCMTTAARRSMAESELISTIKLMSQCENSIGGLVSDLQDAVDSEELSKWGKLLKKHSLMSSINSMEEELENLRHEHGSILGHGTGASVKADYEDKYDQRLADQLEEVIIGAGNEVIKVDYIISGDNDVRIMLLAKSPKLGSNTPSSNASILLKDDNVTKSEAVDTAKKFSEIADKIIDLLE